VAGKRGDPGVEAGERVGVPTRARRLWLEPRPVDVRPHELDPARGDLDEVVIQQVQLSVFGKRAQALPVDAEEAGRRGGLELALRERWLLVLLAAPDRPESDGEGGEPGCEARHGGGS
jgi:hypothetical protein